MRESKYGRTSLFLHYSFSIIVFTQSEFQFFSKPHRPRINNAYLSSAIDCKVCVIHTSFEILYVSAWNDYNSYYVYFFWGQIRGIKDL